MDTRKHSVKLGEVLKPIGRKESQDTAESLTKAVSQSKVEQSSISIFDFDELDVGQENTANIPFPEIQFTKSLSEIQNSNVSQPKTTRHRSYDEPCQDLDHEEDLKRASDLDEALDDVLELDRKHLRIIFDQLDRDKDHFLTHEDLISGLELVMGSTHPKDCDLTQYFGKLILKYEKPEHPSKWSFSTFCEFMMDQTGHKGHKQPSSIR